MALIWDSTDAAAEPPARELRSRLAGSRTWHPALMHDGVAVFSAYRALQANLAHKTLWGGAGAILGRIFVQRADALEETCCPEADFSLAETQRVLSAGPNRLIERYWGWYVAFVVDAAKRCTWILRSPMSDLPCYHTHLGGINFFFSCVEDFVSLQFLRTVSIDWELVQLRVGFGQAALLGQSAIREIAVVERGEAVWVKGVSTFRRICWDPCKIAGSVVSEDPVYITRALRSTVRSCVHSWAARHEAVLHRLSGGLDSSVVLHCLATSPGKPRVTCVNYYWDDALVDERVYARAIADRPNVQLLELRFGTGNSLGVLRNVRLTVTPVLDVIDWQESSRERALARETGATAVFMGSLGDALFERDTAFTAPGDYLRTRGLDSTFFATAMNVALHQRTSVWRVLLVACKDAWLAPPKGAWSAQLAMLRNGMFHHRNLLVGDEAALQANARARAHVWLRNVDAVPLGKLWQIAALFSETFYDRHLVTDDDPPIVAAFLSQPLVELCLRTPTHMNVRRGVDRAMIREAFAQELPPVILRRSSKGSPETWVRSMIERDASFVREFLLDGLLVKERVVDRERLARALPGKISTRASTAGSIMNLLYTEAWLRAWCGTGAVHGL